LRQSKGEGLLIGGSLGGKQDGGGFAPTRLENGGHGNLLEARQMKKEPAIGVMSDALRYEPSTTAGTQ
jgi:hypothetical protein